MTESPKLLVATRGAVVRVDPASGRVETGAGLEKQRPASLAADPLVPGRAWCGTLDGGIARTDDGGRSWRLVGLAGEEVTAVATSPAQAGLVWAGTAPSGLWRSDDGGESWQPRPALLRLPSSSEWSFPPRPETHHVRWIACDPGKAGRLWVAIEAGALVSTEDGGGSWRDRVPGGPYDTHELAVDIQRPERLRVAAGDGYFESSDGGATWSSPEEGLEVTYLRSVAVAPGGEAVVVSGAPGPYSAYVAGRSEGHLYRRGEGAWERVRTGWPDPPETIAPLLTAGAMPGELWAADERGLHRSADGGRSWEQLAAFSPKPYNLRGLALLAGS